MLGQVLKVALAILSSVATILGLTQQIKIIVDEINGTVQGGGLQTEVDDILAIVSSPTYGNSKILDSLVLIAAQIDAQTATLLTAIGTPQQTSDPVTLPSTYPGGWSAGLQSDAQSGVWTQLDSFTGATTLGDLSNLALVAGNTGDVRVVPNLGGRPFVMEFNSFQSVPYPVTRSLPPELAIGLASPGDNLVDFLTAQNAGWTWYWDDPDSTWAAATDPANEGVTWFCTMSNQQFQSLIPGGGSSSSGAPIWPGLTGVVFGSTVALAEGVTLTEPMAGVLIAITGVPSRMSGYTFDDVISYVRVGALAFFSDNGDEEDYQLLGFQNQVYCCRILSVAAGVKVRTTGGVTGTLTSWLPA